LAQAKPGDFFRREWYGIVIYGYAMTQEEVQEQERSLGASGQEASWTARNVQAHYTNNGLLYGRAASEVCPEGEYGSTPASETVAISQEEYEAAELREWKD
jgi:hypothetical protein